MPRTTRSASRPARTPRRVELAPLGPIEQLRAGRLGLRLPQLFVGLLLFGASMAMLLRGGLGLEPWGVLHYGLALHLPVSIGAIVIVVSFVVLLLWIPLKQAPGLGTIANALVIGLAMDATLAVLPPADAWPGRGALMLGGVLVNGFAGALYIGSQFGPGPRDGLMTGLHRRTGVSIRLVRTLIEVAVLAVGWLLGGTAGVGTVLYAFGVGPIVQFFLPRVTVRLGPPAPRPADPA